MRDGIESEEKGRKGLAGIDPSPPLLPYSTEKFRNTFVGRSPDASPSVCAC
jgi:hypothetical protein